MSKETRIPKQPAVMLEDEIAQLAKEILPARDLWPGIEKAINEQVPEAKTQNTGRVFMPTAWAASIVAAVLLTWLAISPNSAQLNSADNIATVMQQDFQQQKHRMLVSFGMPDIKQLPVAMQTELIKLNSAQKTISQALVEDPNNSDLLNLLRWTQQQELELLTQLYSPQWQSI
ncbi:hypothetical protein SAMN05216262_11458 [Colwellia chukchiensis]|uniref:Uncharacterized protein n=1 Tax=Colwellia chukchiensis TaxID=641665 RepID=A0A1H7RDM4_9GAMM|nr:hypothetical protein [Colwellia chukchiensis]SEL58169.1 hypothetical protein SAMN05216262_11458 [Colwellia chukchiensis]